MTIDLRQDAPDQSDVIDPQKLSEEIEKLKSIQNKISTLKAQVKDLEEDEKYFVFDVIPKLMYDMNLSTLKLKDGSEVSVGKKFHAAAYADKKAEAIQWLRSNGLGDIVKNEITVKFGLNEDNKAEQYASLARGQGYEPDRKIAVHAGTLRTTLRDYHQKGGSIPAELFTTFEGNQTHIKTKN